MYSTCLFCHANLGTNEVLESFRIGRRLAYDAAKGRLWVVCTKCGRWNLSPLEERWEVVEECERLFRGTRLRVSTENIGLARLAEGTDLVRVGLPQRPELAAWRYGSQFRRRYWRSIAQAAYLPAIGAVWAGLGPSLAAAVAPGLLVLQAPAYVHQYRLRWGIVTRFETPSGERLTIRGKHLKTARILPVSEASAEGGWHLQTHHETGSITVHGTQAMWLVGQILGRVNRVGGGKRMVESAVARLNYEGGGEAVLDRSAAAPPNEKSRLARWWYETGSAYSNDPPGTLRSFTAVDRLALEMAAHEEAERRALDGELQILEAAWREAEEIAGIADSLALPAHVEEQLARHRKENDSTRNA